MIKDILPSLFSKAGKVITLSFKRVITSQVHPTKVCLWLLICSSLFPTVRSFISWYFILLVLQIELTIWFLLQTLELWNPTESNKTISVPAHMGLIAALADSPQAEVIASASHDQCVKLWKWDLSFHVNGGECAPMGVYVYVICTLWKCFFSICVRTCASMCMMPLLCMYVVCACAWHACKIWGVHLRTGLNSWGLGWRQSWRWCQEKNHQE